MKSANLFVSLIFGASVCATGSAFAQQPDDRDVSLVRQDFSDCSNANVSVRDTSLVGGTASVVRGSDARTRVIVDLGGQPATTYHFFPKCVRLLGDITTDLDGAGSAVFEFRTEEAGDIFAFDSYPEGAPSGNKYQSVQVNFRDPPPPAVPSPRIDYLSQIKDKVSFDYEDMPAGSEVIVVNAGTGSPTGLPPFLLSQGGTGSADITIPSQGVYYLLAQGPAPDRRYIGQTVKFYIN